MILKDLFAVLKADMQLKTLLGATAADPKIYPGAARPGNSAPYVVYRSLNPGAEMDEVSRAETVVFEIFAADFSTVLGVSGRLTRLLTARSEAALSGVSGLRIYRGALAGGSDFTDERGRHVRALTFQFSFIDGIL